MGELLAPILTNPLFGLTQEPLRPVLHRPRPRADLLDVSRREPPRRDGLVLGARDAAVLRSPAGSSTWWSGRPSSLDDVARARARDSRARRSQLARDYESCPACYKPVEKDFLICPYCMKKLRKPCIECGKALKLNWEVCPYCKTKQ